MALAISSATVIGVGHRTGDHGHAAASTAWTSSTRTAATLESAGFDEESTFTSDGTVNNVYRNDQWTVGVLYYGDASTDQLTVSLYSNS